MQQYFLDIISNVYVAYMDLLWNSDFFCSKLP